MRDPAAILDNLDRIQRAIGDDPAQAVGSAKELIESTAKTVLIERGNGRYEPREVKLGRRGDAYTEVLEGVAEGERVVTSANFLIDAESNLKSALGGFSAHAHGGSASSAGNESREAATPEPRPPNSTSMDSPSPPSEHSGRH